MKRFLFSSLTRIAQLPEEPDLIRLDHSEWETADYVAIDVIHARGDLARIELPSGRMAHVFPGDRMVGALGVRSATLEAAGDWRDAGKDLILDALTSAGLFGRCSSFSPTLPELVTGRYLGHLASQGRKLRMLDFVPNLPRRDYRRPTVLVIGTSMSAGKTIAGRVIVRLLRQAGLNVAAAKVTGAGRYRDIISLRDSGADPIYDFVDAGLPSTVCRERRFRHSLDWLLSRLEESQADVVVVESGASPLEPYNGAVALEMLGDQVRCMVLCTADPYAAVGLEHAFGVRSDVVTGPATNTQPGINLLRKLTHLPVLNLLKRESWPELGRILLERLATAPPTPRLDATSQAHDRFSDKSRQPTTNK